MKKRLLLLACLLMCLSCFVGCGKKESKKIELTDEEKTVYETGIKEMIQNCSKLSKDKATEERDNLNPKSVSYRFLNSWVSNVDDLGELKSIDKVEFEFGVTEFKVRVQTTYEKHKATYIFFFDKKFESREDSEYIAWTDVNLVVNLSMGEKLKNAGFNTLLGMGSVFIVLIIIIFFISMFKYINKLDAYLKQKKEKKDKDTELQTASVDNAVAAIEAQEELNNDEELVAVISAAIAAYEADNETFVEGFRVRSIRRAVKRNW